MKKVQVKDLKKGDVLASGAIITSSPVSLVRTPKGKLTLGVKYPKDDQAYARTWGKYTVVEVVDTVRQAPEPKGWSYKHAFGVINVEGWGDPFLVITEDSYFDGDHYGYNYRKLETTFTNLETAKFEVEILNKRHNLPKFFTPEESEAFLLELQVKYPEAEIAKK